MTDRIPTAFFAYPSDPLSIGEIVKTAAEEINKSGHVHIKGWEECRFKQSKK